MQDKNISIETASGVIWISGLSGSGKTTVGRKVEARLRNLNAKTIFLDGDDLRSIFSDRWGYERADRIDLARVYFRLCSHLASEGNIVIIAAVAMYDDVRQWVRQNISNSLEVFLDVPEYERVDRDAQTKKIYDKAINFQIMYDMPTKPDLVVSNYNDVTPDHSAELIVEKYITEFQNREANYGRSQHWSEFYKRAQITSEPSPFARHVAEQIKHSVSILEIGCGNGRDAKHFAERGHKVVATDAAHAAIELCKADTNYSDIQFIAGAIPQLERSFEEKFDIIYSRFVLHAMTEEEERQTLESASHLLKEDGRIFIECRSINDSMARIGEVVSKNERINGHYRRFIVLDDLVLRLEKTGFIIINKLEARDLAVHGDENPVVIRIAASLG